MDNTLVTDRDAKLSHGIAQVIQRAVTPTPENRHLKGLTEVEKQGLRSLALKTRKNYCWGEDGIFESLHGFLEYQLEPQAEVISRIINRVKHGVVKDGTFEYKGKIYKVVEA